MSARQPAPAPWYTDAKTNALNARLNASEAKLRARIGDQQVDDLIDRFMAAGKANPALFKALYAKRDPYRWLARYWAPKQRPTNH